jgi:hypothetical protein
MTAVCQLCKATVQGPAVAEANRVDPFSEDGVYLDYDALSAYMWVHITDFHPNQVEEGIMQQRRAAKMYAMNWANIAPELESVRQRHRATLLVGLTVTTEFRGDNTSTTQVADGPGKGESLILHSPAGVSGSSSASSGDGSNEKKSVRNASN